MPNSKHSKKKSTNPYLDFEPRYPCPQCSKLFDKTADLYQHLRENHRRPKTCHICGHQFAAYASLLSHSYIHSDAKPFICGYPDCEYATRTKQNTKVHMHFCTKCPAKKYRVKFPLPERYRDTYKYQHTLEEHQEKMRTEARNTKVKRKSNQCKERKYWSKKRNLKMMQRELDGSDDDSNEDCDSEETSDYMPSEGSFKKYKVSDPYLISSSEDEEEIEPPRKKRKLKS